MMPKALVSSVLLYSFVAAGTASAQSSGPGVEVAAQTAMLRLSDSGTTNTGIGGRLVFDLSSWVALDGEVSFFPKDNFEVATTTNDGTLRVAYHRRRSSISATS